MTTAQIRRRLEERYGPLPSLMQGFGNTLGLGGVVTVVTFGGWVDDTMALAGDVAAIGEDFSVVIGGVRREQEVEAPPADNPADLVAAGDSR